MKNISIIAIPITFLLFGCAANPIEYQTSASRSDKPTKISYTTQGITIGDFSYNPPGELSQFDISNFGCIPCKDNGSSIGISFTRPIHEIVKYEVSLALSEIILPKENPSCNLLGAINIAGHDVGNGDQILDVTYIIKKNDTEIYKKRVKVRNPPGPIIGSGFSWERTLQGVSQRSAEEIFANGDFKKVIKEKCEN